METGKGIKKKNRTNRRSGFDGNTEGTVIKRFQGLVGGIECSFWKDKNRYSFFENGFQDRYTFSAVHDTASVYRYDGIFINKSKHGNARHFHFSQRTYGMTEGFGDD